MKTILITGGAGFFGSVLKQQLLDAGYRCISLDLCADTAVHSNLVSIQGDIRDAELLGSIFREHDIYGVMHVAAVLAHAVKDEKFLWESNVDGTRVVAEQARKHGVRRLVFTSSNCLWGESVGKAIKEDQTPNPVELYGQSKLEGEKILLDHGKDLNAVIIRCPTIIDAGRLGLLSILFEFIDENRTVWVVGSGKNKYQFIYAPDLADACIRSLEHGEPDVFHIGSDNVQSLRDVFGYVVTKSGSRSRIRSLPRRSTLLAMRLAHYARVSPLGPYHYKMIAEDFEFDTTRIKQRLGWRPTLTNETMLLKAYQYYSSNKQEIVSRTNVSAHRQSARMGVIRALKWLS